MFDLMIGRCAKFARRVVGSPQLADCGVKYAKEEETMRLAIGMLGLAVIAGGCKSSDEDARARLATLEAQVKALKEQATALDIQGNHHQGALQYLVGEDTRKKRQWCREPPLAAGCYPDAKMTAADSVKNFFSGPSEGFCLRYVGTKRCMFAGYWTGYGVREFVVNRVDAIPDVADGK